MDVGYAILMGIGFKSMISSVRAMIKRMLNSIFLKLKEKEAVEKASGIVFFFSLFLSFPQIA